MRNANRPSSMRLGGFFIPKLEYLQWKARHDEDVAPVCLNTPSAIPPLRSLETGNARSKQSAPELSGLAPEITLARSLYQLCWG